MTDQNNENTRTNVVLAKGTKIAHYRIIEKVGAGGMGEVYLAEDTKLNREVAIKFLPTHLVANEEIRTRFVREAQTLAKVNHPNVVSIYDVSEIDGRPYYVMEMVEGEVLHHYAHEEPLSVDLIIEYAIQICQGLGEAHRAGIVHRDIKSANIAVDNKGRIRLLDFGLAAREGDDKITKTGSTLGTVAYMSPEQVSGREIDQRSDLFSLGIVLYELIAGRTPFRRENEGAILKAIIQDAPEPLTRYKSDVPDKLQDIVMKLLEKDRELRYQSAEGVIADLKRLMYDSEPTGRYDRSRPEPKKRKGVLGAAAVVIAVLAIVIWRLAAPAGHTTDASADEVPMIAVLPFENLGAPEDKYFADGITDEITSRLAGISGLGVISRSSAMKYTESNKTLKEFGEELGVDYILEGTVRWSKVGKTARVRITPQLVRVTDDRHLWADNYERELLEVFAVQADIATKIVDQLGITLLPKDRDDLDTPPTDNAEAYALYLRALAFLYKTWDLNAVQDMRNAIDSAITLDPDFALAHAFRSSVRSFMAFRTQDTAIARQAMESAQRALQIDPQLPEGHLALGNYYNLIEEDYDRALEEFNIAKRDLHNESFLFSAIGLTQMRQGRFHDAVINFRKSVKLDPLNPENHHSLGNCLSFIHAFKDANDSYDRAIALAPSNDVFWEKKLWLYKSWTGDWNAVADIAREALKNCDSVDFLSDEFRLMDQFPEIDWERIMREYRVKEFKSQPDSESKMQRPLYYISLASMNDDLGDSVLAQAYADSARITLEKRLSKNPDDFHSVSNLGLIHARLGDCDKAIEYGQNGVDLMSVDKCHW